jgi:hypothetical protein
MHSWYDMYEMKYHFLFCKIQINDHARFKDYNMTS